MGARIQIGGWLLAGLFSLPASGANCPANLKTRLEKLTKKVDTFTPSAPAQAAPGAKQNADMGVHAANAGSATNSATACSNQLKGYGTQLKALIKSLDEKDADCEQEAKQARAERIKTQQKAAECDAAGAQAKAQGDTSGDNKDKMGEKEKDKEGGGSGSGGGGSPQQSPQQQQQQNAAPTPAQIEAAREARISSCKRNAASTLSSRQAECESLYSYDPNHAVPSQLQLQNNCKQNAIFASQTDNNNCETANPFGSTQASPMPSDNFSTH